MEPTELSEAVLEVVKLAQDRVGPNSIGAQQYHQPGEPQKFEKITIGDLLDMFVEETLDIVNYGVMLTIRLQRLQEVLSASGLDRSDLDALRGGGDDELPSGASAFTPSSELPGFLPTGEGIQSPRQLGG